MRAFLDDAAGLHHQDAVAGEHGRQPMRDHQRGAPAHQALERVLDQGLALGVERGGRLVEQQQRRVAQDRARDGDALALAAGQRDPALADRGVEAAAAAADELEARRELGGALDLGVARIGRPKRMFSRTLAAKMTASCGTSAMRRRSACGSASATRTPSNATVPERGS